MAFSPAEFYTIAGELRLKASQDGPHLRTLISRAYYGALIVARDAKQLPTKGEGGHERVINAYPNGSMVSDNLRTLRRLREKADYEPKTNLTGNDGQVALSCARRVLQSLQAMPAAKTVATPPPAA